MLISHYHPFLNNFATRANLPFLDYHLWKTKFCIAQSGPLKSKKAYIKHRYFLPFYKKFSSVMLNDTLYSLALVCKIKIGSRSGTGSKWPPKMSILFLDCWSTVPYGLYAQDTIEHLVKIVLCGCGIGGFESC